MQFSGEEHFAMSRPEVWQKLTDASFLGQHLPGLREVEQAEPKRAICRVRPGFSFLSAPMKMTVEIYDEHEPATARMRVRGEGIAASLSIETTCELQDEGAGTKLVWNGQVTQMGGLLKTISRGLLEGAAKKIITDGWSNIRVALDGPQS
jgi:carbon monoxide dehydrogenase subunit G